MKDFILPVQLRWSDLDPNFHLRHSVYYDWGALCRVEFMQQYGLTSNEMLRLKFGLILLREECVFRKEIRSGDRITIGLQLLSSRRNYSRWTILHPILKNGDTVSALLTVDGAWFDTIQRKLAIPPPDVANVFGQMPKGENFQWLD